MNENNFKSERYFTVFDFLITHGQLLFRSNRNDNINTNLDIIFFDVKYLQLITSLFGISINIVSNLENLISYKSIYHSLNNQDTHLFEIESKNEKFYLVASYFKVYENELEFNETSLGITEIKGREKQIGGSQ